MSINNLTRYQLKDETDRRVYHIAVLTGLEPYCCCCINFHRPNPKGHFWSKRKNKRIARYQYRMYRTWKYNRKTQYKIKNDNYHYHQVQT